MATYHDQLDGARRQILEAALADAAGDAKAAARALGLPARTLYRHLHELGISAAKERQKGAARARNGAAPKVA